MKLLLPLHCYDEAGRVKPPLIWYLVLAFLARAYLIALAVFSSSQPVEQAMQFFYPTQELFYSALLLGLPAMCLFVLTSLRSKLFNGRAVWMFRFILPVAIACLCIDIWLLADKLSLQHWTFTWSAASVLLIQLGSLMYLLRSRHMAFMIQDWLRSDEN